MAVLFISNVGDRDVQLAGQAAAPHSARSRGDAILADWDNYAARLELPILGKALRWVARRHGPVDRVVLVATDQPEDSTLPKHYASDTLPFAQVIARALVESPAWEGVAHPAGIAIAPVNVNPADYDQMLAFYEGVLPELKSEGYSHAYLCITGGAPGMNFGLIMKGIEHLGAAARLLYVSLGQPEPMQLDLGRQMLLESVLRDIRLSLEQYQYPAVLRLVEANESLLREMGLAYDLLHGLVEYAAHRLNFNFQKAERALSRIDLDRTAQAERIAVLQSELRQMQAEQSQAGEAAHSCLREVLAAAEISLRTGAYMSFVGYVYRLTEGLNEVMLQRWAPGLAFEETSTQRQLSAAWLAANPAVQDHVHRLKLDKRVSRRLLLELARYYANGQVSREQCVAFLGNVYEARDKRHALPLAHGCRGVTVEDARKLVRGSKTDGGRKKVAEAELIPHLKYYFERMTGEAPGENPFDQVNALVEACLQLLPD